MEVRGDYYKVVKLYNQVREGKRERELMISVYYIFGKIYVYCISENRLVFYYCRFCFVMIGMKIRLLLKQICGMNLEWRYFRIKFLYVFKILFVNCYMFIVYEFVIIFFFFIFFSVLIIFFSGKSWKGWLCLELVVILLVRCGRIFIIRLV